MQLLPVSTDKETRTHILDACGVCFTRKKWIINRELIQCVPSGTRFLVPVKADGAWLLFYLCEKGTKIYDFQEGYSETRFKLWDSDIKANMLEPLCDVLRKPKTFFSADIQFVILRSTFTVQSDSAVLALFFAERLVDSNEDCEIENIVVNIPRERSRIMRSIRSCELLSETD